jgi:hypothetical protein
MDLEKLKVVELRAELSNRGLDTKGTKPVKHLSPVFFVCKKVEMSLPKK